MPGQFHEFRKLFEPLPSEKTHFGSCFISPLMERPRLREVPELSLRAGPRESTSRAGEGRFWFLLSGCGGLGRVEPIEHGASWNFWEFVLGSQL